MISYYEPWKRYILSSVPVMHVLSRWEMATCLQTTGLYIDLYRGPSIEAVEVLPQSMVAQQNLQL